MAVEFCKESAGWTMSPRISFSHDLTQSDRSGAHGIPVDRHRSDSFSDFDFCVYRRSEQESSSADELFSDGKILPLQFKRPVVVAPSNTEQSPVQKPSLPLPLAPSSPPPYRKKGSLREIMSSFDGSEKPDPAEKPAASRSFWPFRRSSSLNCSNGYNKTSSIWSLQLLSRSNSVGSTAQSPKHTHSIDTQNHKPLARKPPSNSNLNSKAFPPSPSYSPSYSLQKPPLKKKSSAGTTTNYGSYGNGIRINPVLNVPPTYISKGTTSLFGFGYFFCNRKYKKIKKKKSFPPNAP